MSTVTLTGAQPRKRTNPQGKSVRNKILLAVPDREYKLIRPHLEFVRFPHHSSLHEPHHSVEFAHFPNVGLISLVVELKDGKSVEAAVLGNEGVAGMPGVLGLIKSPLREIVQVTGSGFRVRIEILTRILKSTPTLQMVSSRYAARLAMQMAQTTACNRFHHVEKRMARWLLIVQDRVDSGLILITQDLLARLLGTDRPSVSIAARAMQELQIITYNRGTVRILNRKMLEDFACECYGIIRQYSDG